MEIVVCWRCEKPGHVAAECTPPPAGNRKQLYERLDRYVERYIAKEITPEQKRKWIADEVKAFNPKEKAK